MAKLENGTGSNMNVEASLNLCKHGHEQCTGGCQDNSPGQVKRGNVDAEVVHAYPKRIDSMGGSESRGKGNSKSGGY